MSTTAQLWDRINVGYEIPALTKKPTYMQLFMFSAITWNRHLIHYNNESAKSYGLPDVVVHRALIGNFFAQMLNEWIGDTGKIAMLEWSVRNAAFPGDILICQGKVVKKNTVENRKLVECELWIENQNGVVTTLGQSEIELFL